MDYSLFAVFGVQRVMLDSNPICISLEFLGLCHSKFGEVRLIWCVRRERSENSLGHGAGSSKPRFLWRG